MNIKTCCLDVDIWFAEMMWIYLFVCIRYEVLRVGVFLF